MRSLVYLALVAAATQAYAQTLTPEQRILQAYTNLRPQTSQYLSLDGQIKSGSTTDTVKVEALYKYTPATTVGAPPQVDQIDLQVTRNGTLTLRLVADGRLFRSFDYASKTFWVAPYAHYSDKSKAYDINHSELMQSLVLGTPSESAYVARLLREVYGDPATSYYSTWIPGVTPTNGAIDPDTNITYADGATYELGNPVRRLIGFVIEQDQTTSELILKKIGFFDVRRVGGQDRTTQWSLSVEDVTAAPTYLDFVPPTTAQLGGWRQVVRPTPVPQ